MTILHVTKKYPDALGGDAVVVANLQKQQQSAGHRVVIVTSNCDEIMNDEHVYKVGLRDTAAGLDTITLRRLVSLVALFFRMFAIVGKERPNVIHAHSIDMAFFASFAARFYGVPIVHTFHIVTFYDTAQPMIRRRSEVLLARLAGLRYVTAPNVYDVHKLQDAGLRQAVLLPNGVDLAFWKPTNRNSTRDTFTFLSVGRLEHQKGYEYLVRATALLADAPSQKFRVVIVGEGSQATSLQKLAHELQVDGVISFAGRKSPQQVRSLLAQADAAIFSSLYETTPITMLEAWAAAVPVIATPVGILRDMPADHGATYLVPAQDAQALQGAMHDCMTNAQTRTQVATRGHSEVKKYAWPAIARTAETMYRSVA
jgi:glycosyltransferase involved in cell wall biosynthesis